MIRYLVDFALREKFLVLGLGIVLLVWGFISFHRLPVEAYPDVADNYVNVITQWPGRAAEEVERQVTIPLELQMNGLPHLTHLRSTSLFGISSVTMVFDDDSIDFENRQRVLERLSLVSLPANLNPQIGPDYSPVGQIYFYTLQSTDPRYDIMALKSLQDWVVLKQLKSVPDIADVDIFGGMTREYQVQVDPNKLIGYGLSIAQVEQALAANNGNAGGSVVERGQQAFNVRVVGLMETVDDVGAT
ncbi:MAG: efflux RND transporter permease subunit, partial [Acidobacteriota bacterium]|nr:efflux RND transporter permease subunit [Acidobacteriota bacterium]